jgi:soluble lytic murein transglycosylase-like protein
MRRAKQVLLPVLRVSLFLALALAVSVLVFTHFTAKAKAIAIDIQKAENAYKVTQIMNIFRCADPEIHAAIMETFDPVLVAIVVGIESNYQVDAVSPAGCRGLMQLSPGKLQDWTDVRQNIAIGARYLQRQIERFGSVELAIAAYNAGPESVILHQGIPPYRETRAFIAKARILSSKIGSELQPKAGRS